jgi:hypothetical protein
VRKCRGILDQSEDNAAKKTKSDKSMEPLLQDHDSDDSDLEIVELDEGTKKPKAAKKSQSPSKSDTEKKSDSPEKKSDSTEKDADVIDKDKVMDAIMEGSGIVKHLCLDNNYFGDDGANVVTRFLTADSHLLEISCQNCGITDAGFSTILASLCRNREEIGGYLDTYYFVAVLE